MYLLPKKRQTLFFSATINEQIKKLAYKLVKDAIRIQISPKDPVAKNIDHAVAFVEMDDKRFFLENFLKNHVDQKVLIFVRTQIRAERVKKAMERVLVDCETLHGGMEQLERETTMTNFRSGDITVLIATDVSARGIDIDNVEYVINYDLPDSSEHYIHRVGRTGRGRNLGQAISFCSPEEKPLLEEIEENLGKEIKRMEISKKDYQYTLEVTETKKDDWQSLMDEDELDSQFRKKKKGKKR
jgi:ATP-dependent RNA helicase RhlE